MSTPLRTPVLFIIFNRPDTTMQVFEAIRKAKPTKLFIAADGYRPNKEGEKERCAEVRSVADMVDWPCEVSTLFRDQNLGCQKGPWTAMNWFFDHVEEGIILEDDCLPSESFFGYCTELLERYRDDERIMSIAGDGHVGDRRYGDASYHFSPLALTWGWATWRRAWKLYDLSIETYPSFKANNRIADIFPQSTYQKMWMQKFEDLYNGKITTAWDYQWAYALMCNHGLAIIPNTNMITNIGFGEDATHTFINSPLAAKPRTEMGEITHPQFIIPDTRATVWIMKFCFFTNEREHPLSGFFAYKWARSLYGKARTALGLNS